MIINRLLIIETSCIIRIGLTTLIREKFNLEVSEYPSSKDLSGVIEAVKPHIILINTELYHAHKNLLDKVNAKLIIIDQKFDRQKKKNRINYLSDYKEEIFNPIEEALSEMEANEKEDEVLSDREKLILKHIALGASNKEIANKLFISIHTVTTHRKNITHKLDIKSVAGLTVYAILNNIVDITEVK